MVQVSLLLRLVQFPLDGTLSRPVPGVQYLSGNPLPATIQPTPYVLNSLPFKFTYLQFRDKNEMWDHIERLAEVQVDNLLLFSDAITPL